MSHCYLCFKSKNNIEYTYFEYFIAEYFPALNKKDPELLQPDTPTFILLINIDSIFCFKLQYNNNVSFFGVYHKILSLSTPFMLKERAKKVTQSARRTRKGFFQHLQIIMSRNYHLRLKTESTRLTTFKSRSDYHQFTMLIFPLRMMVRVMLMLMLMVRMMVILRMVMVTNPYKLLPNCNNPNQPVPTHISPEGVNRQK